MNAFSMPGAESASAALRRVERERDEAREALYTATWERDAAREDAASLRRSLAAANGRPTPHLDAVKAERDLARAELASAQQELDALRTTRDWLDNELVEARRYASHLSRQLGQLRSPTTNNGALELVDLTITQPEGAPPA